MAIRFVVLLRIYLRHAEARRRHACRGSPQVGSTLVEKTLNVGNVTMRKQSGESLVESATRGAPRASHSYQVDRFPNVSELRNGTPGKRVETW